MNDSEELLIGEKTWRNVIEPIEKDGYREGCDHGRQVSFQNGFDEGYKEGFEDAFLMSYKTALLRVKQKFGFISKEDEVSNMTSSPSPWLGNCELCRSKEKS